MYISTSHSRSRYWGAAMLVSIITLVIGCTALNGQPERRGPTAIEIPLPQAAEGPKAVYPPRCNAECQKISDAMSQDERLDYFVAQIAALDDEVAFLSATKKAACKQPSVPKKAKPVTTCPAQPAASAVATAASQPAFPADIASIPSLPPDKAASASIFGAPVDDPAPAKTSKVGSYDWMWNAFGYADGLLVYKPYWGANKSVDMRLQKVDFTYTCKRLHVPETDHLLAVQITAAVKPSIAWESNFHVWVANYGAVGGQHSDQNVVTAADIKKGAELYLGQFQEALCQLVARKSLDDFLRDPTLGSAATLNKFLRRDVAPFEITVQTTEVNLPSEVLRPVALKARMR